MKPKRVFFGCVVEPAADPDVAVDQAALRAAVEVMRPKPSPVPLMRIGGKGDGAYLVPDDLQGVTACFSPGVNNFKNFEDELTDRHGMAAHLCDLSSDVSRFRTPMRPQQTFRKVWLEPVDGEESVSLGTWVAELAPDPADDLLLQMDIEGAEYRNLLVAPEEVMRRFRIIVLEVHGLDRLTDPGVFGAILQPFLAKLDATHVCVHAHPNNCCGHVALPGITEPVPKVHELTFLRRDRFPPGATLIPPELPHALDIGRNVARKAPLFLDEAWLGRPRSDAENLRIVREQLAFEREQRQSEQEEAESIIAATRASAEAMATALRPAATPPEGLVDVAPGKPILLGPPRARGLRRAGVIEPREPVLFDTGWVLAPSVTIDLGRPHEIHRVVLRNRTDRQMDRARHLFLALHDEPEQRDAPGIAIVTRPGFLNGRKPVLELPIAPTRARCVTIHSPARTSLHLAGIEIHALPAPDPSVEAERAP